MEGFLFSFSCTYIVIVELDIETQYVQKVKLSKKAKKLNHSSYYNILNFSNSVSIMKDLTLWMKMTYINQLLEPPHSRNSQRGRTYCILKQTEIINLQFDARFLGLSIFIKSESKDNKFVVEWIDT